LMLALLVVVVWYWFGILSMLLIFHSDHWRMPKQPLHFILNFCCQLSWSLWPLISRDHLSGTSLVCK
jgi:hypothetical protein